jgi:exodeoxyribonuclease VII large subunit
MIKKNSQTGVLTVSQLTKNIKSLIENTFPEIWVKGEISNFVRAASGHCYFSLKDDSSQVRCVLFRSRLIRADFEIDNGLEVEVLASPSMFEKRGEFQLVVQLIQRSGIGQLFERYEKRKSLLAEEGLFESDKKKPLPRFPKKIGVVTSKDAAALRDVCKTLADRAPSVSVVVYHSPVQGVGSGLRLAEAVLVADARCEVDVLIICRGGGSYEDLWEFNSEELIRAIAQCSIPTISGVGHETDTTLVDFVCDHHAVTPTAAAAAGVYSATEIRSDLRRLSKDLLGKMRGRVEAWQQQLDYFNRRLIHPGKRNASLIETLTRMAARLSVSSQRLMRGREARLIAGFSHLTRAKPNSKASALVLNNMRLRIRREMANIVSVSHDRLARVSGGLSHLDPKQVVSRGYSIVRFGAGEILTSVDSVAINDQLKIQLSDGELEASVTATKEITPKG